MLLFNYFQLYNFIFNINNKLYIIPLYKILYETVIITAVIAKGARSGPYNSVKYLHS